MCRGDQEKTFTLSNMLALVADEAEHNDKRYVTKSLKLNALQTIFTLAQCTPDLFSDGCSGCLSDVIGSAIPWARLGSIGGRVLYPSCNLRFELFQFYRDGDKAAVPKPSTPPPSGPTGESYRPHSNNICVFPMFVLSYICVYTVKKFC